MTRNEDQKDDLLKQGPRVLIIDGDTRIRNLLKEHLESQQFKVDEAINGEEGLSHSINNSYTIIIMDIELSKINGLELIEKIRSENDTPIIVLTEKNEELIRVQSFEKGIDDYVIKPFSPKEIVLRIKAILHRIKSGSEDIQSEDESQIISLPPIEIDNNSRRVTADQETVVLTPKEFDLLYYFMSSPDQIFGREQLLRDVWQYEFLGDLRTVDTHIKRLREKLKKQSTEASEMIETVWGLGYRLNS